MKMEMYTGGVFETNAYFLPELSLLIDAPEGVARWVKERGFGVKQLWLTHGHIDHYFDAAEVCREAGCSASLHPEDLMMVDGRVDWRAFGINEQPQPLNNVTLLTEGQIVETCGRQAKVLYVPGHSPGSVCFYFENEGVLFGGDVLFRQAVGRWDLPGGDRDVLLRGIREKVFVLPADTVVYPGHGPETTVGYEKKNNPWVEPG